MATLTSAEIRDRVLERLNVKPLTQSASAEVAGRVDELVASAYARLRKLQLCPYASSAIPDWAQVAFIDFVAWDAAPYFGKSRGNLMPQQACVKELSTQIAGTDGTAPVKADFF